MAISYQKFHPRRGRPLKTATDIELVWVVRAARAQGLTVEAACKALRSEHDKGRSVEQLVKRYHRVASAYPTFTFPWRTKAERVGGFRQGLYGSPTERQNAIAALIGEHVPQLYREVLMALELVEPMRSPT